MDANRYKEMMTGLVSTAVEKIAVLGREGANKDLKCIIDLIDDLECFWNSDETFTQFDFGIEIRKLL